MWNSKKFFLAIMLVFGVTVLVLLCIKQLTPEKTLAQDISTKNPYTLTEKRVYNEDTKELMKQASEHIKNFEYRDAIDSYTQAIDIEQDSGMLHYARGISYLSLKDYDAAADDFSDASQMYEMQGKPEVAEILSQLSQRVRERSIPDLEM